MTEQTKYQTRPFSLEHAKEGAPVTLRAFSHGRDCQARILAFDMANEQYPLAVAYRVEDAREECTGHTSDGYFFHTRDLSELDLLMAPMGYLEGRGIFAGDVLESLVPRFVATIDEPETDEWIPLHVAPGYGSAIERLLADKLLRWPASVREVWQPRIRFVLDQQNADLGLTFLAGSTYESEAACVAAHKDSEVFLKAEKVCSLTQAGDKGTAIHFNTVDALLALRKGE